MEENIPLDGTNVNDAITDKDAVSLLIMRQAFIDATRDDLENAETTDELTDNVVKEED